LLEDFSDLLNESIFVQFKPQDETLHNTVVLESIDDLNSNFEACTAGNERWHGGVMIKLRSAVVGDGNVRTVGHDNDILYC
jgi:hypothetical protein